MIVSSSDSARVDQFALKQKEAIIFDMDGVIVDSEPLHERASQLVFAQYGIELDENVFNPFKGKTDRNIVEFLIDEYQNQRSHSR